MTLSSRAAPPRVMSGRTGQGSTSLVPRRAAPARGKAALVADACWAFARRRPGVVACTAAVLALTSTFGWNALHQANRHPAPLFGSRSAASLPEARKAEPAVAPLPVPRPEALGAPAAIPDAAPRSGRPDPIGAMIRSADAAPKPDDVRPDPARVSSAQKTLSKLGYGPLKSDGVMGATTRQALERFEKDRNLPVTGSLAGRTARQLAAQAQD